MSDEERTDENWGVFKGDQVVFSGSYADCCAEAQRRHEERQRTIADSQARVQFAWEDMHKSIADSQARSQLSWEARGARDD